MGLFSSPKKGEITLENLTVRVRTTREFKDENGQRYRKKVLKDVKRKVVVASTTERAIHFVVDNFLAVGVPLILLSLPAWLFDKDAGTLFFFILLDLAAPIITIVMLLYYVLCEGFTGRTPWK